ncbi:hypothetical protein BJX61DRAFT_538935 [Aspergillus egyptiacus]|nr:hypothetical protein BJX61DRAFT_538935 [Aspergillus egyptiacus]
MIWPFGRRGKRHTIQGDADPRGNVVLSQDSRHSLDDSKIGRKPSRKPSKRQKNRHSLPVEDFPSNLYNVSSPDPQTTHRPPSALQSEPYRPVKAYTSPPLPTVEADKPLLRNVSLRKSERKESPARLQKRLSKRKAYEIAREREIRMMSSMPIDIPRRTITPLSGDSMQIDSRRPHSGISRRVDPHRSDVSLSVRESAASSISDFSETYTFKVNGLSAWTPRPVIRYVETPRTSYCRNQRSPEPADRRIKSPTLEVSEENLRSKTRIDELADDLDAGALRELMERDRRRRERKQFEDQDRLARKLERSAQQAPTSEGTAVRSPQARADEPKISSEAQRGRSGLEEGHPESQPTIMETEAFLLGETEPQGSWLRDHSRDPARDGRESLESVHVIGNIDDSSIRERKASQRLSIGPSQDMAMSRSTLSASIVPSRQGLGSPDSSQFYNTTRESVYDRSRDIDSERRMPENSGARVNTITSIFRRGSSRLKRSYRERFPDRSPPPVNNISHESFFKVHTPQQQATTPYVRPKLSHGSSSFKRSQSKFTEHFGDEPLSPPDSRFQSPDIPEDKPMAGDQVPDLRAGSYFPIPSSGTDGQDGLKIRHHSWAGDSIEDDPDNVPLSQSLASIDSEGSWMSGQFLRRLSQKPNSARQSLNSSRYKPDEVPEKPSKCDEDTRNTQFLGFGVCPGEESGDGPNIDNNGDKELVTPHPHQQAAETWHQNNVAKRPVLVTPSVRPKSTEGLLNSVRSLSVVSSEEFSPIEEHSSEFLFDDTSNPPLDQR